MSMGHIVPCGLRTAPLFSLSHVPSPSYHPAIAIVCCHRHRLLFTSTRCRGVGPFGFAAFLHPGLFIMGQSLATRRRRWNPRCLQRRMTRNIAFKVVYFFGEVDVPNLPRPTGTLLIFTWSTCRWSRGSHDAHRCTFLCKLFR
jgi:hypothetical protein